MTKFEIVALFAPVLFTPTYFLEHRTSVSIALSVPIKVQPNLILPREDNDIDSSNPRIREP